MTTMNWRKSTRCEGGACVEASPWRRSSSCASHECVEAAGGDGIMVRDSSAPDGPVLAFTAGGWRAFTERLKAA